MPRPPVDIVVPFVGSDAALERVAGLMAGLDLLPGDTVVIADNRADSIPGDRSLNGVTVRGAAGQPSSYFARNRGVAGGTNPWLVFLDADVIPEPDLLAQYFSPEPSDEVGLLIGGIVDLPAEGEGPGWIERHAQSRGAVSHETAIRDDGFTTAQTANAAVRRPLFEQLGGFTEGIRSGGDAELSLRVQRAGYRLEPRFEAKVLHKSRTSLKSFARQWARYGAGADWVNGRFPGFAPRLHPLRLVKAIAGRIARAIVAPVVKTPADSVLYLLDAVRDAAYHLGHYLSNEVRPHAPAPVQASPATTPDPRATDATPR